MLHREFNTDINVKGNVSKNILSDYGICVIVAVYDWFILIYMGFILGTSKMQCKADISNLCQYIS